MLTYDDCLAMCDLTEDEVRAIAAHRHIPALVAMEYGNWLCECPDGVPRLRSMIQDDLEDAVRRGDAVAAAKLRLVLRRFVETHPAAAAREVVG